MRSDLDSQNKDCPAGWLLQQIRETLVGSLLGLTLSGWVSPAIAQKIYPEIASTIASSGSLMDKTGGSGNQTQRSPRSAVTTTTQPNLTQDFGDRSLSPQNRSQDYSFANDGDNRDQSDRHTEIVKESREQTNQAQNPEPNSYPQPISQNFQFLAQRIEPNRDRSEIDLQTNQDPLGQITSVSQLSDVKPTDWAFQALQSLVERYGCISGYPDLTYRGNRALTRYEFAAALNACWDQIDQLIQANPTNGPSPEDLQKLQQLQQDFNQEIAIVNSQIQALETQTSKLNGQQFSTTTKLFGQAIFGVQGRFANEADFFPVDDQKDTPDPGTEINLINNVQLTLLTQLNSRSLILAGMQLGNGSTGPRLSNDTRLGYEGNTDQKIVLSDLNYRQLISNRIALIVGPAGVNMANVFRGVNRVESAGRGPISALAQRNPIVNIGNGRGGIGFDWQVTSRMSVQGVYSASTPADVNNGGLFGGDDGQTALGVQFTFTPINTVDVALNYVNAYSPFGVLGTGSGDDQLTVDSPIKTNGFGATVSWRVTPRVTLGSWAGYTNSGIPGRDGDVETTNWMVFLNWENLFGRGNLGGIYVGQPPKIVDSNLPVGKNLPDLLAGGEGEPGGQPGTTTHVELFYRWEVSEQLSFTPGMMVIFEPGHTPASDPITVGVLRTTFNF